MSTAMNSSSFIIFFAAFIAAFKNVVIQVINVSQHLCFSLLFMYVQALPLEHVNDATNLDNIIIPRHTKRSIYGLYRYIPKMDENKIKKDYDDSFEGGYARRYYFTE